MDIAYINDRIRQISARIQSAEEDELDFLVLELDLALRQHALYVRAMLQGSLDRLPSPKIRAVAVRPRSSGLQGLRGVIEVLDGVGGF